MKPQGRTGMLNTNQGTTFAHPQHHPFLRWRGRSGSMEGGWSEINLPGFRFHPTEEELLDFYLKGAVQGNKLSSSVIEFHNIYRHDPRELPGLARTGEREWYFFVPRDKLSSNGGKPKRTTERGFWKATGSDRPIRSVSDPNQLIGLKKTLVFYEGRAPRGLKTDWIMNEYRLPDTISSPQLPKGDIVLCKIYRKAKSMKELEKRVAPEGKSRPALCVTSGVETYSASATSSSGRDISVQAPPVFPLLEPEVSTKETTVEMDAEAEVSSVPRILDVAKRAMKFPTDLGMLQVPPRSDFDWMADPNLMRTPWLDHISPCYANIFNF